MKIILIILKIFRIWGTENTHTYIKNPKRVTVWCGFQSRGIIGPFFFENNQRVANSVNGDRYRAILNELLFTKLEDEDIGNIWFQYDGDTCHTAEAIGCDFTPLDYYLCDAVKDKCYTDKLATTDALKDNICEDIGGMQLHTIDNVL